MTMAFNDNNKHNYVEVELEAAMKRQRFDGDDEGDDSSLEEEETMSSLTRTSAAHATVWMCTLCSL
jgi:hypothetical protein